MRLSLAAALLVLYAASASAQTGTPASWNLRIYQQGGGTQVVPLVNVSAPTVACNQAAPTSTNTENPTKWVWDDVSNAGKVCIYLDATRLQGLPDGQYEGTAQAVNADGSSAESARAPFTRRRPNPPAAPSGVRLTQ